MRIAPTGIGLRIMLAFLSLTIACSKSEKPQQSQTNAVPSVDHVSSVASSPPNHFLHKTFTLQGYEKFNFTVPAHTIRPTLRGSFVSFSQVNGAGITSNKNANVELMLLNDQEFDDFVNSRSGNTTYATDPSFNQVVEFAVPATYDQPQNYSLVFRNPPGGPKSKLVKADFTISFQ